MLILEIDFNFTDYFKIVGFLFYFPEGAINECAISQKRGSYGNCKGGSKKMKQ